jgi:hypothetical protein
VAPRVCRKTGAPRSRAEVHSVPVASSHSTFSLCFSEFRDRSSCHRYTNTHYHGLIMSHVGLIMAPTKRGRVKSESNASEGICRFSTASSLRFVRRSEQLLTGLRRFSPVSLWAPRFVALACYTPTNTGVCEINTLLISRAYNIGERKHKIRGWIGVYAAALQDTGSPKSAFISQTPVRFFCTTCSRSRACCEQGAVLGRPCDLFGYIGDWFEPSSAITT